MKPTIIYLESSDLELVKSLCPGSTHFFLQCSIVPNREGLPFQSVTVSWINNRLARRAMRLMLKELITLINSGHQHRELLADIAIRFIDRI